jgi:hypothetical protein
VNDYDRCAGAGWPVRAVISMATAALARGRGSRGDQHGDRGAGAGARAVISMATAALARGRGSRGDQHGDRGAGAGRPCGDQHGDRGAGLRVLGVELVRDRAEAAVYEVRGEDAADDRRLGLMARFRGGDGCRSTR